MKLTKSKLKVLIKECIVEVLSEGLAPAGAKNQITESARVSKKKPQAKKRKSVLDSIKFDNRINETASSLTDDPVMQSIFSDTAKTTLQEQLNHSSTVSVPPGADRATHAAAAADPSDLFAGSSNWAALAFTDGENN